MTTLSQSSLRREAVTFGNYLTSQRPSSYLVSKYLDYHEKKKPACAGFDAVLVGLARLHPVAAFVCDSYATWFHRHSALKKKLVLMLALFESTAAGDAILSFTNPNGSQPAFYAGIALRVTSHVLSAVGAVIILSPLRVFCALFPTGRAR
jgi:hypothetical protein